MRLLCDQNVAQKYVDACIAASDFQAVTVRDVLDPRASDLDIAAYAKTNEYIVLTYCCPSACDPVRRVRS